MRFQSSSDLYCSHLYFGFFPQKIYFLVLNICFVDSTAGLSAVFRAMVTIVMYCHFVVAVHIFLYVFNFLCGLGMW